jgi:hypothetical protein
VQVTTAMVPTMRNSRMPPKAHPFVQPGLQS